MRPRALFLVPADYDELQSKGVDRMIRERDEDGFFERVITVHPLATRDRVIDLDAVHRIHEFSLGCALRTDVPWRRRLFAAAALPRAVRRIVSLARRERVDVIRANDPYLMGMIAWWVSRRLRIPFCVSLHADYEKRFELTPGRHRMLRRLARVLPRFVFPRASLILPIRQQLTPWVRRAGGREQAVRVIPHGIDLAPFERPSPIDVRAELNVAPGAPLVSFAGRFADDNYMADMAAAIAHVARSRPAATFVLAGDGPAAAALRTRLTADPAIARAVRLVPFQPYEWVVALRQQSTASLCLMGGFSLIEACAAGSPVIAYDVEWHRELVATGSTGFLVREHDVDEVVRALQQVIDEPAFAAAMGRRAREAVAARHDLRHTSAIKRACYLELLNARRAS